MILMADDSALREKLFVKFVHVLKVNPRSSAASFFTSHSSERGITYLLAISALAETQQL